MKNTIKIIIMSFVVFALVGCSIDNNPTKITNETDTSIVGGIKNMDVEGINKYILAGEKIVLTLNITNSDGKKEIIKSGFELLSNSENIIINGSEVEISRTALTGETFKVTVKYKNISKEVVLNIVNALSKTIDNNNMITNADAYDVVVDKKRFLSAEYIPSDLVGLKVPTCLQNPEVNQLREAASQALYEMFEAAKEENINLVARSGYRSYATQTSLYNGIVKKNGQDYADKYSAIPGQSEHQTGLAIDITAESVGLQLEDTFGDTLEGKWVLVNAHKFGFIIRYPENKENITGYMFEPWHLRYLGVNLATEVYTSGLTLEEYFLSFE